MDYMPNVKSLLTDQGTFFRKHYCTVALCCPSRASILAGRCVHNINVTDVSAPYGGYEKFVKEGFNEDYLPLWLQEGGINTCYVGKLFNGLRISNYLNPKPKGWTSTNFLLEPGCYDYLNNTWAEDFGPWESYPGQNAVDLIPENGLAMLNKAVGTGKPWFLTIAPAVPHVGINASSGDSFAPVPQEKWINAFMVEQVPRTSNWNPDAATGVGWIHKLPQQNQTVIDLLDDFYRRRLRVIAGLDDMVADLVNTLESSGQLENTHIIYTTDNVYHIGTHRLGPGKECAFESDVNMPLVWRGPGIASGQISNAVSSHTDLAPTLLALYGLDQQSGFDGRIMPITSDLASTAGSGSGEHVNIEMWGVGVPYELYHPRGLTANWDKADDTYKALRIQSDSYSYLYTVWCTNAHELYDMQDDPGQMNNLLEGIHYIHDTFNTTLRPLVERLDTLTMVLKSCQGTACMQPWQYLFPQGQVLNLTAALAPAYDAFFTAQPKVSFSASQRASWAICQSLKGLRQRMCTN